MPCVRALPGMTVVSPAAPVAVAKLLPQIAAWPSPVYVRLNRHEVPVLFDDAYAPQIGRSIVLRPGADITLVGTGLMVSRCLDAADLLAADGIDARVLEVHTIKPLDNEALVGAARETGAVVTADEHSIIGGLGGAVAEVLSSACPVAVERVGIRDRFATSGLYTSLLEHLGLSAEAVAAGARRLVSDRSRRGTRRRRSGLNVRSGGDRSAPAEGRATPATARRFRGA